MSASQWNFVRCILLVNGTPVGGWSDGDDVINIQWAAELYNITVTVEGHSVRSRLNDDSATIVAGLRYDSISNGEFENLARTGQVFPLSAALADGTTYVELEAIVSRRADHAVGSNPGRKNWTIHCSRLTHQPSTGVPSFPAPPV